MDRDNSVMKVKGGRGRGEVWEERNWRTYAVVSILNIFNKKLKNKTKHKILSFNIYSL